MIRKIWLIGTIIIAVVCLAGWIIKGIKQWDEIK